jgi:hypothetical protein
VTIIYYFGWLSPYARRRTEDTHELLTPPRPGTPTTHGTVPGSPGSTMPQITKAPHVGAPPCARGLVVLPWGFGGVISVRSSFSLADVGAWCVRARCGTLCSSGAPGVYKNCRGHARPPGLRTPFATPAAELFRPKSTMAYLCHTFEPFTVRPLARDLRVLIGRPGFPFGFLGAGGRLPKARRGRVFIVQYYCYSGS